MEKKYCQRLVLEQLGKQIVLLGIIVEQQGDFIKFRTKKGEYLIHPDRIIQLGDTKELFEGEL